MLYLGRDRCWVVKNTTDNLALKTLVSHETDLEKVKYGELTLGDFNADGSYELVAPEDRKTWILEILQRDKETLTRQLHFAVFEDPADNGKHNGGHEPRELLMADINGDN